jgi:lipoprotein-anchoring transpeptidase ErfK/SrfK
VSDGAGDAGAASRADVAPPATPATADSTPVGVSVTSRTKYVRSVTLTGVAAVASGGEVARRQALAARPALIAAVRSGATVVLRDRPGGRARLRLGDRTEFDSARRLGVVRRQGRWLGVTTPELPNGVLGWIDRDSPAVDVERTRWRIRADVSRRTVTLLRAGRVVRRLTVAVGRPGSPTPTGRFAVTDKLSGGSYGPYYGCCILALSATQPNTPPGWTGGNRMAIHGTSDPGSIGQAASAGCLRAADGDLALLIDRVPVGTPVVIAR